MALVAYMVGESRYRIEIDACGLEALFCDEVVPYTDDGEL